MSKRTLAALELQANKGGRRQKQKARAEIVEHKAKQQTDEGGELKGSCDSKLAEDLLKRYTLGSASATEVYA